MKTREIIECGCCGEPGSSGARGWRRACYERWLHAGKPAAGPPPLRFAGLIEDYAWLTREQGHTLRQAADRLGVTERTGWRYEKRLREQSQQQGAA